MTSPYGRPPTFTPSLETTVAAERLKRLIVSGEVNDPDLVRRGTRLELLFCSSLLASPTYLWGPGLRMEREWRNLTETFLPWNRIAPALRRLIAVSLLYPPPSDPLIPFPSWPDFLQRCSLITSSSNPALLLRSLLADEELRRRWLFTLFLPKEHGGGFHRYPRQQEFIHQWLVNQRALAGGQISCLDAACGSGEGSWELAALCRGCGFLPHEVTIHGSSLDPLELFAAAHADFPHDPPRQREYRRIIAPVTAAGFMNRIRFTQEELAEPRDSADRYDLILCNGLLGGPMLHNPRRMERVVAGLVQRLRPGGLLLAADRFHEGWDKLTPKEEREALLGRCGVKIMKIGEGIGGRAINN